MCVCWGRGGGGGGKIDDNAMWPSQKGQACVGMLGGGAR